MTMPDEMGGVAEKPAQMTTETPDRAFPDDEERSVKPDGLDPANTEDFGEKAPEGTLPPV